MLDLKTRLRGILLTVGLALTAPGPLLAVPAGQTTGLAGSGQELRRQLEGEEPATLARDARRLGDPVRGAVLFFQPQLACAKCHDASGNSPSLGPDLTKIDRETKDEQLVESILQPSRLIKQGFESVVVLARDGRTLTGIVAEDRPDSLVLRDPGQDGKLTVIAKDQIEDRMSSRQSIMPEGLAGGLANRQEFLDLVRYIMEIAEHGPDRARQLRPAGASMVLRVPAYEQNIDHAGLLRALDNGSFRRGQEIYELLCINCHGTKDRPGSLPTSLRFAADKFKNGSDPYGMYRTLTYGFGMMLPQTWMVPQQKYDVIHYIREAYLQQHNASQYRRIDDAYLATLPEGTDRGPRPIRFEPWLTMDYGPSLIHTYEIPVGGNQGNRGEDGSNPADVNFAYKGIAVRLDAGPGGIARGRHWMVFDHDTLRVTGAWSKTSDAASFINWDGIMFNGRHAVHPRVAGQVHLANPIGPGWANPADGSFTDPRLRGRDNRPYGPLPRDWAHYKGLYHFGQQVILSYTVGNVSVLERPGVAVAATGVSQATPGKGEKVLDVRNGENEVLFTRTFNIGPRDRDMILQVAQVLAGKARPARILTNTDATDSPSQRVLFGRDESPGAGQTPIEGVVQWDGATRLDIAQSDDFDMHNANYTITARIRTGTGGSIFCKTEAAEQWVPDGKSLFVRGGKLVFDIGWVGKVESRRRVNDNQWHTVAMTYEHTSGAVRLYIDGQPDGQGRLRPKGKPAGHTVRIGFTALNFPEAETYFQGEISEVRFHQRLFSAAELAGGAEPSRIDRSLVGWWQFDGAAGQAVTDSSGQGHEGQWVRTAAPVTASGLVAAGLAPAIPGTQWISADGGLLRLRIAAGTEPLRFTLWAAEVPSVAVAGSIDPRETIEQPDVDLTPLTRGGPARWPAALSTSIKPGDDGGPLAVDVLTHPADNPWFCRTRFTGFDFLPDGDRAAVCAWDGDVWLVSGLLGEKTPRENGRPLRWQRIASGLFQPLGLKIIDGQIFVSCRDQIAILRDLNGDGETDFYQNFNNDHQVTEHFHEFAMGLQTDEAGNLYYAKSARHALPALVPHHGTLLRVSKDGSRTDILANGFRAANGVCLNSDGSFFVTDQEGHWTPKNRINWVTTNPDGSPKFYGNMFGYHDVTDASDSAMEQPLCWITNAFDRSPAELLWVTSDRWGPLRGSLLNLSYGYGKVYVVPHERVAGQMQGGMCELPLAPFPTGVMRGHFHPEDGQLYLCGMFAWAGNAIEPGGFYRVRYTGKPIYMPIGLEAWAGGIAITFTDPLDRAAATDPARYSLKTWTLRRSANYGSDHHNERPLEVAGAQLSTDGRTVFLELPRLEPSQCMSIAYQLRGAAADRPPFSGLIHNTIHALGRPRVGASDN